MADFDLTHQVHTGIAGNELTVTRNTAVVAAVQTFAHRQVQQCVVRRMVRDLVDPVAEPVVCLKRRLLFIRIESPLHDLFGSDLRTEGLDRPTVCLCAFSNECIFEHRVALKEVVWLERRRLIITHTNMVSATSGVQQNVSRRTRWRASTHVV